MAETKDIVIPLDEKSYAVLLGIIEKHKLVEDEKEVLEKAQTHAPFNETVAIGLTRGLILEKISNQEFLDGLHKELKLSKEEVKNLAIDIADNLIPLLEKIPEDHLEAYNRKKTLEQNPPEDSLGKEDGKNSTQELILAKINKNNAEKEVIKTTAQEKNQPHPYTKNVGVKSVEENAKKMEKNLTSQKEEIIAKEHEEPSKVKTVLPQSEQKGPDDYREPLE